MTSVRDDLIAARSLIDTPEKWGKGDGLLSPDLPLRCIVSAACAASSGSDLESIFETLRAAVPGQKRGLLQSFNDAPATTHNDILALFDRAINAASEPAS